MCEDDYINIGSYTFDLTSDDHKVIFIMEKRKNVKKLVLRCDEVFIFFDQVLMESGKDEQRGLGARWINRLPTILDDPDLTQTRATYWQRTYGSAEAFLEGAYPGQNVTFPHIMDTDILLR